MADEEKAPPDYRRTTLRFPTLNGNAKYLVALIIGALGGGGGWAASFMGTPREDPAMTSRLLVAEEKVEELKELRLGGIEGRLGKIEKVQSRHGRVLDAVAAKLKVSIAHRMDE